MRLKRKREIAAVLFAAVSVVAAVMVAHDFGGWAWSAARRGKWRGRWREDYSLSARARVGSEAVEPGSIAWLIVQGAKQRALSAARYEPGYRAIAYPMGDVPDDCGACTDVVVRSLRYAGIDLQELIHEDMARNFDAYPRLWGLSRPDPNIDHRRIPNQMCYMRRHWLTLPRSARGPHWRPGDIVYWRYESGVLHCGVVSDRAGPSGLLMVVHNNSVCRQEDCLARWHVLGHFRRP